MKKEEIARGSSSKITAMLDGTREWNRKCAWKVDDFSRDIVRNVNDFCERIRWIFPLWCAGFCACLFFFMVRWATNKDVGLLSMPSPEIELIYIASRLNSYNLGAFASFCEIVFCHGIGTLFMREKTCIAALEASVNLTQPLVPAFALATVLCWISTFFVAVSVFLVWTSSLLACSLFRTC